MDLASDTNPPCASGVAGKKDTEYMYILNLHVKNANTCIERDAENMGTEQRQTYIKCWCMYNVYGDW